MRKLLKYIILLLIWIGTTTSKAELSNSVFDIRHIGYLEGLSSQRVFSIAQDKNGVIWIATKTGIDRFNGHTIKNYTLQGNFYHGDFAGRRLRVLYDEEYGLWAYDHTGRIYRYSIFNDCFEQDLYLGQFISGEIILNKLYLDHKGIFWCGLSTGLFRIEADGNITPVIQGEYVNDIVSTEETIFAGTSRGILQISHSQIRDINWLINEKDVQSLFWDANQNELWIGTFNNGLWVMNQETSNLLPLEGQSPGFINPIRAITEYDSQTLLVGIDGGGVYTVNRDTRQANLLISTEDSTDIFLQGNGVYAVTKDHQDNIWIGSYSGGVSVAIRSRYPVTLLTHERGNPQSLANNNVNDIEENINGELWFATDHGISIWNASSHIWKHVLKDNVVVTLCSGEAGTIWAGTYGEGVYLLNSQGHIIRHFTKQKGELLTNYIFSIRQDKDGDIWIGGLDGDLLVMDKQGRYKQSYDIKWIHSLAVVDNEQIAAATVNGFCLINKYTGEVQRYATYPELQDQNAMPISFACFLMAMEPFGWGLKEAN
ncbi:MAG: hypothetical protein LIP01_12525 [Tannerellaceae bacterium]|nr:hypothetical protein [Tannerellaceae bacterium]